MLNIKHAIAAILGGALYALGFCGFDQWYLAWVCLVPTLWALDQANVTRTHALLLGWMTGGVAHLLCYSWIVGMLQKFGFLPFPIAVLVYILLCTAQSSLFAAWGWATHQLVRRAHVPLLVAAPVIMVVCEWLYPALFPSYLANSQYEQIWAIQSLDVWGPLGVTLVMTLTSATLYQTLIWLRAVTQRGQPDRKEPKTSRPVWTWVAWLALFGGNVAYGIYARQQIEHDLAASDKRVNIGLVQANMGIYQKRDDPYEGLRRHVNQSLELQQQGVDLIIWPESGYQFALTTPTRNIAEQVMGPQLTTPLLFGGLRIADNPESGEEELYNTAFLANGHGDVVGTYDKIFLLAFGEYLPMGELFPVIYQWLPQVSRFNRGRHTDPLTLNGIRYGLLICYEDILPRFVRQVMDRPDPAHVLVNITNDAWFGKSREPRIHLALAAFRAVEQRRYLVRATNSGISSFIDPTGRIVAETELFTRENVQHVVTPLSSTTIYARFGDWLGWLCGFTVMMSIARARYQRHRRHSLQTARVRS